MVWDTEAVKWYLSRAGAAIASVYTGGASEAVQISYGSQSATACTPGLPEYHANEGDTAGRSDSTHLKGTKPAWTWSSGLLL